MVLIDGKPCKEEEVNPEKHRFIGTFRYPYKISNMRGGVVACDCGNSLWTADAVFIHWQSGHFDHPQYVTIAEEK